MENREYSLQELTSRAENYCARAEHCASEVRTKIRAWGGTPAQGGTVMGERRSDRCVDGARCCRAETRDERL